MIQHYIITAWRHLLKYKTQNIISILCLAVGVVCFTLAVQTVYTIGVKVYADEFESRNIFINAYNRKGVDQPHETDDTITYYVRDVVRVDSTMIARIYEKDLPSIREVNYSIFPGGANFNFEDSTSIEKFYLCDYVNISPRTLLCYGMRSAITGKPIPELNDGDMLISELVRDMVYGKNADPRGFRVMDGTIRDVVSVPMTMELYGKCIFHASRVPRSDFVEVDHCLTVEPREGYDADAVIQELNNAFPEYWFTEEPGHSIYSTEYALMLTAFTVILLIGGSVLLVGVSGYLKMQTQLFALRSREMALRRTMGAHSRQLFTLLATETVMVFAATALLADGFTALLTQYFLDIFPTAMDVELTFSMEVQEFHFIKWWVLLGTMLTTLAIAAGMVYRQLHEQPGMRVGRSGHARTRGHGAMLCVQFATGMLLMLVTLISYRLLSDTYEVRTSVPTPEVQGRTALDLAPYHHAMIANRNEVEQLIPDFPRTMSAVSGIDHISEVMYLTLEDTEVDTMQVMHPQVTDWFSDPKRYRYCILASDEQLVDRMGIDIHAAAQRNTWWWHKSTAVYARTEEATRLRAKWNLAEVTGAQTITLPCNQAYTLLGYAVVPNGYRAVGINPTPSFWVVDDRAATADFFSPERISAQAREVLSQYIIFSNARDYDAMEKGVQTLLQEAAPGNRNLPPATNLYNRWFPDERILDGILNICILPVLISILCIIAGVYSSISLETRGRQKEIALRKVHGAHSRDIMWLMGRQYMRLLCISGGIAILITAVTLALYFYLDYTTPFEALCYQLSIVLPYLAVSFLAVTAITLLTIGRKIYSVSQLNAADIIAKE